MKNFFKLRGLRKILEYYSAPTYIPKSPRSPDGVDSRVIAYVDKDSHIAEQYKVLRTNLYSLSPEKPLKTIMITSAQAEEGKTLTCCNLAFTISLDAEKKVLLVDMDLRKPEIHHLLALPRKPGFSDILNNSVDMDLLLKKPAIGKLYVITAGTSVSSPSEILILTKIKAIFEKLKTSFDYIIFDAPPALTVTDASILGALCDGVILVVKAEVTPKNMVEEGFNLLRDAQAKPIATILTNYYVPTYYPYRYKYYYKYPSSPK